MTNFFLEPLDYDNPPPLTKAQIASCELSQGEYEWLKGAISSFGEEVSEQWIRGVFWSRFTGDSGYYEAAYRRYSHLIK